MKKIILCFVACLTMGFATRAQEPAQCDTVRLFPWDNDFYSDFGCWEQLGDSSSQWQLNADDTYNFVNAAYIAAPSESAANGCVLVSPALALPADTAGMRLSFKTRRVGTAAQLRVLVSTGQRENMAGYDTLLSVTPSGINSYEVNLSAYAGQTIYVAFSIVKPTQSYNMTFFGVGSVNIISDHMPQGEWWVQNMPVRTGDTVEHEFDLTHGIENDSNTLFVWHSTMVEAGLATMVEVVTDMYLDYTTGTGRTLPRSIYRLIYHSQGTDTLTLTVSNIYGTITTQSVSRIYDCQPIATFPTVLEYNLIALCGYGDNLYPYNTSSSGYTFSDEDGGLYTNTIPYMRSNVNNGYRGYVVTPRIVVPAEGDPVSLMLRYRHGPLEVRATTADVTDTALFTDLLYTEPGSSFLRTRKVSLTPYAGDTVRLAIIHKGGNILDIMPDINVDYDTLPKIATVQVPTLATVGEAALCTATLRYGATDGLHYSWMSAQGGTFVANTLGDSAWVTYPGGVGENDTIRVVATNAYGTDTVVRTLRILDCTPQMVLPWRETFDDGIVCWYKPEGSNWEHYSPNTYSNSYHVIRSTCSSDIDSWIVSKAIDIPADVDQNVHLFWDASTNVGTHRHNCSVLVTTGDYTDIAAYETIYLDTVTHQQLYSFDHLKVSLAAYAGQTVHIAFRNQPLAGSNADLFIDNVTVRPSAVPVVSMQAPTAVNSNEAVTFTATVSEGSPNGMSYTWHSTLMETTWESEDLGETSSWTITYTTGGIDTVTFVASNNYGNDTATAVVTVTGCGISVLPYNEDFGSIYATTYNGANGAIPTCWGRRWNGSNNVYAPHVINNYPYTPISNYVQNNNALLLVAGTTTAGMDSVAIVESPYFEMPLAGNVLSFNCIFEYSGYGSLSVGYMQDGGFVAVGEPLTDSRVFLMSLSGFPADVHRFALKWKKMDYWYGVIIDDVSVTAPDTLPVVSLIAPSAIYVGDTVTMHATLENGLTDGLSYIWHSELMDSIWVGSSECSIVYDVEGIETIMVVAQNAYGTDTAWAVAQVNSYPLPQLTVDGPTSIFVNNTASFTATMNNCSANGRTLTWHSTMAEAGDAEMTVDGMQCTIYYTGAGIDTVTAVLSNVYGSSTVTRYVSVVDCEAYALPYSENFELVNAGYSLPTCWQRYWNGTASANYGPCVLASGQYPYASHGSKLFVMRAGTASVNFDTVATVTLPQFADDLTTLSLAFWYGYESATRGRLTVGYMVDSEFTPIAVMPAVGNGGRTDTVSFIGADADMARIAFRWEYAGGSYYAVGIDDISVFVDDGLHAPRNLQVDSLGAECVSLEWAPNGIAESYHMTIAGVVDTVVYGNEIELCGLTPNTQYTLSVCSMYGDEASNPATVTFTTLCHIVDLPWSENFEGNGAIACWSAAENTYISLSSYSGDSFYNQFCHSGTNALSVYCSYYTQSGMVFTPLVEHPADEMLVSFWACVTYGPGTLQAGIVTDLSDTNSFVPLAEFQMVEGPGYYNSPAYFEFDTRDAGISDFAAVAFRFSGDYDIIIDDVNIEPLPSCVRPRDAVAESVDAHTATLSWTTSMADFPVQTLITLNDLTAGGSQEYNAVQNDQQGEYTLTGLAAGHIYGADIKTVCSGNDMSDVVSVTVVPSGNACVEIEEGTSSWSNSIFPIYHNADSSYAQILYHAVDAASVDTLFGIAFYVTTNGGVNRSIDVYVGQTATEELTAPVPLSQLSLAVQNYAFTPSSDGWYKINFTNPVALDGESNLIVSIAKHPGGSGEYEFTLRSQFNGRAWFDRGYGLNEYHSLPITQLLGGCSDDRCLQPLISATADLNSIEVEWDKRGGESQWLVQHRLENEVEWTDAGITSDVDGENHVTFVIEGLNASSRYEVRVAALCDDGDSVVSDSVSLATLCGAASVPYFFNFTNGHSDCWQVPSGVVTADLYGENGGARMDDFMAQPRPIVSPEIDRDLNGLKVRYVVHGSDFFQPPVKIGVGDADGGNAVWLDSLVALDGSIEYTYYFNNFTGTQRHIIFYGEFGADLRQVYIDENDECIPVHHVDVHQLMPTSALLQWQPAADESEWAVYLDGALISVTSTPNYQITHNSELLTHNSSYTASVRAICGEGDTSAAVSVTFTTPCTPVTIPWNENFEAYATGDLSGCWRQYIRSFLGNTDANAHIRGTAAGNVLNLLDYAWAYNVTDTIIPNYVSSPLLVGDGGDMTVTFRAAFSTDPVGAGTCIAGVMTDVADTTSFIPLLGLTPVINCDYDVFYDYQFTIPGTLVDSPFALAFRWRGSVLTCFIDDIDIAYVHHDTVLRTVTLVANDPTMGSVTGDGEYMDSSYVSISAVANEGYSFVVWSDGDSNASRQIFVVSDTTLTAYFAATASIAEPITPNSEFRIYPNPASNTVTICRQDAGGPVDILDVHGRVVQTIEYTAGQAIKLDISHLPSGAYFVRMTTDNRVVVKKLIVK